MTVVLRNATEAQAEESGWVVADPPPAIAADRPVVADRG